MVRYSSWTSWILQDKRSKTYQISKISRYSAMRDQYMRSGKGFIIVYGVNSRSSFKEVNDFRAQILRVKDADEVPMVLVATKADLTDAREVLEREGRELAQSWGCPFFETSAMSRINVEEPFFALIRLLRGTVPVAKKKSGGFSSFFNFL
jgi:GTPase KRas protein